MTTEDRQSASAKAAADKPERRKVLPGHMVVDMSTSCETCRAFVASDGPCPGMKGDGTVVPLCHSRMERWVDEIFGTTETQRIGGEA